MSIKSLDIIVAMHTQNDCYKKATKVTQTGIVVHSTAANNPYLKRYVDGRLHPDIGTNQYGNHWNQSAAAMGRSVCVHAFIGYDAKNNLRVAQILPYEYGCWGNGGGKYGSCNSGKHSKIQFEMQEDSRASKEFLTAMLDVATTYSAELCVKYGWNPLGSIDGVPTIIDHAESYALGWGGNHGDVKHWLSPHGFSMNWFRNEVARKVNLIKGDTAPDSPPSATPTTTAPSTDAVKIGDMVRLRDKTVKTFNGGNPASFVFNGTYRVDELNASTGRAVLDRTGICTAYNAKDLLVVIPGATPATTTATPAVIAKGSKVKIKAGAKYYGGQNIPSWVMSDTWIISSISGDRAVLGKNVSSKNDIQSPVNTKDLTLV